jgi:hypothetical protein
LKRDQRDYYTTERPLLSRRAISTLAFSFFELVQAQKATKKLRSHFGPGLKKKSWPPTEAGETQKAKKRLKAEKAEKADTPYNQHI